MARRTKKKTKSYPNIIAFDENLLGVADIFVDAEFKLPEIMITKRGTKDHPLSGDLDEKMVFFTCDSDWLTRQPPYKHGAIIFLDCGNISAFEKFKIIYDFLFFFHIKNKVLDQLKNTRFRLTKYKLWKESINGQRILVWDNQPDQTK